MTYIFDCLLQSIIAELMTPMRERASLIDAESVLAAEFFKQNGRNFYPFKNSTRYDLIIEGENYPPKAIFAKAYSLKSESNLILMILLVLSTVLFIKNLMS